jgi:hypothetical protein
MIDERRGKDKKRKRKRKKYFVEPKEIGISWMMMCPPPLEPSSQFSSV